jgi:hypothetical protein
VAVLSDVPLSRRLLTGWTQVALSDTAPPTDQLARSVLDRSLVEAESYSDLRAALVTSDVEPLT